MKNTSVNKKTKQNNLLWLTVPVLSLAFYILHIASGYRISSGAILIGYSWSYPIILLAEYAAVTLLFIPFIIKSKKSDDIFIYLLPVMLISSLGMMRIDSDIKITSPEADHSPAVMFIILILTLIITAFSGHTLIGAAGTIAGTVFFPAFGLAFSPFIAAAAFLFNDKNEKEKRISVILNIILSVASAVYSIIRLDAVDFSFSKKYIPVIFLIAAISVFFVIKKDYRYIPVALLPVFPLAAGVFFKSFSTELFTLSASVAPFVMLTGTCALSEADKKITGYAQRLVHNPAMYLIVAVFILHTAYSVFVNPGYFRNVYI